MFKRFFTLTLAMFVIAVFSAYSFALDLRIPGGEKGIPYHEGIYVLGSSQRCNKEDGKGVRMANQKRYLRVEHQAVNTYLVEVYETIEDARNQENLFGETDFDFSGITDVTASFIFTSANPGDSSHMILVDKRQGYSSDCQLEMFGVLRSDVYRGGNQRRTQLKGYTFAFCPDADNYLLCEGKFGGKWLEPLQ